MTPDTYVDQIPEERKAVFQELRSTIKENLPAGFEERISYGMIGYVVPHELYPEGYHCDPKLPLPFLSIASQKNFIAVYHMGIYADEKLLNWFIAEYPKYSKSKLDMGKSCIRFKKMNDIPLPLIALLCQKMTPLQWIELYENAFKK
jgi:hypothetical protein